MMTITDCYLGFGKSQLGLSVRRINKKSRSVVVTLIYMNALFVVIRK